MLICSTSGGPGGRGNQHARASAALREAPSRAKRGAGPRSGGWVEIPPCTAGGWRSAWARGITRRDIPSDFGRAEREAEREIHGKHFIGLSECTKNVVGTTKAVHEFCGALKRGAKATGREVTRHGHRAVDRGRPTSGGPVRSTGRTAFFPSHSVPTGPPFLTGRTSTFLGINPFLTS